MIVNCDVNALSCYSIVQLSSRLESSVTMWVLSRRSPIFLSSTARSLAVEKTDPLPKPFNAIPGPAQIPLLGNSLELKGNIERLRFYIHDCFEKYGSIFRLKPIGEYLQSSLLWIASSLL